MGFLLHAQFSYALKSTAIGVYLHVAEHAQALMDDELPRAHFAWDPCLFIFLITKNIRGGRRLPQPTLMAVLCLLLKKLQNRGLVTLNIKDVDL